MRSVSVGLWVNVGARDESDEQAGACHFIEHMVFKGTATRSAFDIAAEMDAIGGHTNAFTSMEHTCYHGKVMDTHADRLTDILSDIFLHSVFDPTEIQRERDVILQEVHMLEDSPEDYLHLLVGQACFGDHPLGRSVLGTPHTLAGFDTASIVSCFNQWYRPGCIVIAAAGNVDHDRFTESVRPAFEPLTGANGLGLRQPPTARSCFALKDRDLEQTHLCLATPGLCASDPDRYAYSLLNVVLGGNMSSRLFQEIREKRGLAYSVYSFAPAFSDAGLFGIYAAVAPDKAGDTIRLVSEQLARLKQRRVSDRELASAKEYVKGSIVLSQENTDSQMLRLAQNESHFGRYVPLSEVASAIDAVTAEDIRSLANRLFLSDSAALAALGPLAGTPDFSSLMGF